MHRHPNQIITKDHLTFGGRVLRKHYRISRSGLEEVDIKPDIVGRKKIVRKGARRWARSAESRSRPKYSKEQIAKMIGKGMSCY